MSEYKSRASYRSNKRLGSIYRRFIWYCLSAIDGKRKFHFPSNIHSNDWYTWTDQPDISIAEFSYKVTITAASLAGFGVGIWQLYLKLVGH